MKKTLILVVVITILSISLPMLVFAAPLEIKQRTYGKIDMIPETLPSVAVFVLMPPYASNPTAYAEQTYEGIREAFEKTGRIRVLPMQQTQKIYRGHARNRNTQDLNEWKEKDYAGYRAALVGLEQQEREKRKKWESRDDGYFNFIPNEEDLLTIGQKSKADYAMFVSMKVNRQDVKNSAGLLSTLTLGLIPSARVHQTALWDIVLVDNSTGEFLLDEAVTDIQGTSGSGVTTDRVFTKLVKSFVAGLDFDKLPLDDESTGGKPFFQPKEKSDGDEVASEKNISTANGTLGTPNVLLYNTNVATWTTYDISYNQDYDRIIIRGSFTNNTSNYIARVKNMQMNIILMDNDGNYVRIFSTKFGNHDINIKPHGTASYTYVVKGIPYDARYSGNYHISYNAQYYVKRSSQ